MRGWLISTLFVSTTVPVFPMAFAQDPPPVFREVSASSGLELYGRGRGSGWTDVNGDGLDDVGIGLQEGGFWLYRNLGGLKFAEVTRDSDIDVDDTVYGVNFVDVDNDGDADLFLACGGFQFLNPVPHRNHLFLNDGLGHFEEVPGAGGLAPSGFSFSAAWSDVNRDGLLDVFICRMGEDGMSPDRCLFLNRGGARFEDVTLASGVGKNGDSHQALFCDVDADGDPDLILANRDMRISPEAPLPIGNQLFLNDGSGNFRDASVESGIDLTRSGFAATAGDVDRDGDLDVFLGAYNNLVGGAYFPGVPDCLLLNDGKGHFTEVGTQAGIAVVGGTMGACFLDFDNDGWPDLYVSKGGAEPTRTERDLVYRNRGDGTFVEVGEDVGIRNRTSGHGATADDADQDGDLDLLVPSGGMVPGTEARSLLFENMGADGNAVSVRPQGELQNRDAVGARVLVESGGRTSLQEVTAGSGFASQMPAEAWFGLDGRTTLDEILVIWPSGTRRVARDVPAKPRLIPLHPVVFSLGTPEIGPVNPNTGLASVRLSWEDPRPHGAGEFMLRLLGEQGVTLRAERVGTAVFDLEVPAGTYAWSVTLMDDLGAVSASDPVSKTLQIQEDVSAYWTASPNPFRAGVTVSGPSGNGGVRAEVVDLRGKRLAVLVPRSDGDRVRFTWSGRTAGGTVAPGVYWIRIYDHTGREQALRLVKVLP